MQSSGGQSVGEGATGVGESVGVGEIVAVGEARSALGLAVGVDVTGAIGDGAVNTGVGVAVEVAELPITLVKSGRAAAGLHAAAKSRTKLFTIGRKRRAKLMPLRYHLVL
jgi:hypothetical protein